MKPKYKKSGKLHYRTLRRYFLPEFAQRYLMLAKDITVLESRIKELNNYAMVEIKAICEWARKMWLLNRGILSEG